MGRNSSDNEEDEHEVPMKGPATNNNNSNTTSETNDTNNNDSSFLDDDFLSFAHVDNGGENKMPLIVVIARRK